MINFENHPEIGEKIFGSLDLRTLLNCQLVCQDWRKFLQNPNFWLKKLKGIGQPDEINIAWKILINKSCELGIAKNIFTKCLQMKFKDFITLQENEDLSIRNSSVYYLKCPPLYTAAYYGFLEIVKLIYQLKLDFNRKIYWVPNLHYIPDYYEMPIFAAIQKGHTVVVEFFCETPQEKQKPSIDVYGCTPIMNAIIMKNLSLVKFLTPSLTNPNQLKVRISGQGLIHLAIRDLRIFKHLMSLKTINPNLLRNDNQTALQLLCNHRYTRGLDIPAQDIIEMVRILAPLADVRHSQYTTRNPLHIAALSCNADILKILVLYFDANIRDDDCGFLPIDWAVVKNDVEAVKVLAPFTKELKIHESLASRTKLSNVLNLMEALIEERKKTVLRLRDSYGFIL